MQTLFVTTAVAFAFPLGAVFAQTSSPLAGAPSAPVFNPARTLPSSPDDVPSPMQEQAMAPDIAPSTDKCGSQNTVTMRDEFGRKYNCRGDRVP
jgi:hypothetical protein